MRDPDLVSGFLEDGDVSRACFEPRLVEALLRHSYRQHTRELQRLLQIAITDSAAWATTARRVRHFRVRAFA